MDVFHFALRPHGFLFLGSSESLDGASDGWSAIDKKHCLFRVTSRARSTRRVPTLLIEAPITRRRAPSASTLDQRRIAFGELHQRMLEQHEPPSMIVNAESEIIHLSEHAGRFILLAGGEPSLNVLKVVLPELRLELRTALFQAFQTGKSTEARRVQLHRDGRTVYVTIVVRPERDPATNASLALVLFNEVEAILGTEGTLGEHSIAEPVVRQLEEEVQHLKVQLQATVEQDETTVEELKASNEEMQTINEELRATTEELETSKEELQAVNEELRTVNSELKLNIVDVSAANADLSNLMSATDIATLFLNRSLCITRYTPRTLDLFNLIPSDAGRQLAHVTHKLDYPELLTDIASVLRTVRPFTREISSHAQRYYLARIVPYHTTSDRLDGIVLTFVDITARKQAEIALRASEERYRTLFASMSEAFAFCEIIVDADGKPSDYRLLDLNPSFEQMTGITPAAAAGKTARELVPDMEDWLIETYGRVALTGEAIHFEYNLVPLNRWFEALVFSVGPIAHGTFALLFYDITERKQQEVERQVFAEQREQQARVFATTLATIADLAYTFDKDGRFIYANQAFLELLGLSLAQVVGKNFFEIEYPAELAARLQLQLQHVVATRERVIDEMPFTNFKGVNGDYEYIFSPVVGADGRVEVVAGSTRDVTARKAAEAEIARLYAAEQAARLETEAALHARDQFISIAAHELRTPLTALMGYSEMLHAALIRGTGDTQKMTAHITRQSKRLNWLIDELLDGSHLQHGQFVLDTRTLDLVALVEQVMQEFRVTLPTNPPRDIAFAHPEQPVLVMGDAHRLEQVLLNLLSNAVKYSPEGGWVRVQLTHTDSEAVLAVADQGIGIPAAAQSHLFEPFYRASNVGTRTSGFGLGLYIVGEIVQRHGGHIEVLSTEGEGSTFRMALPLSDSSGAARQEIVSVPASVATDAIQP